MAVSDTAAPEPVVPPRSAPISRPVAGVLVVASLACLIGGALVYALAAPSVAIVKVELGGAKQAWPLPSGTRSAVWWDFALIAGYGLALLFALWLAYAVFWSRRAKGIAAIAALFAVTAVVADVVENVLILSTTHAHRVLLDWAAAAAVVKFCCLTPAAIVAVTALAVTVRRLVAPSTRTRGGEDTAGRIATYGPVPLCPEDLPGTPSGARQDSKPTDAERWRGAYDVPDVDTGKVGVCLSGGGVRSASVALGAMQAMRPLLTDARYLVSVSGGGYTAGALQLALTAAHDDQLGDADADVVRDPDAALMPGSVEEDWVRCHADYLADTPSRMVVALGVVGRCLLLSLALLFAPALVLGVAIGRALQHIPLVSWDMTHLHPWAPALRAPSVLTGTWYALGVTAGLALVVYVASLVIPVRRGSGAHRARLLAEGLTLVALTIALIAVGLPFLAYGASWLMHKRSGGVTGGGSVVAVLLAYGVTARSLLRSKTLKAGGGLFKRGGSPVAAVPAGALQLVLSVVTLVVLAAAWLLLLGGMIAIGDMHDATLVAIVVLVILVPAAAFLDQTWLSLHPFYRRRLAGAFAVRRRHRAGGDVAEGYDFDEVTTLSRYAARPTFADGMFPEVVFAGTANLTGQQRAPLDGVPYTFGAKWVGGPDIGYMHTEEIEAKAKRSIRRDLTVEAAVAISGAAFASAMGRAGRWYQKLFAVTGLRLGSWLPNPLFVAQWNAAAAGHDWTMPGMPARRRLSYLLREIFGLHHRSSPLLQVTDGGHYENLGLVELLRRRCRTIYCIDASGDSPPTATTLEQAITIARSELGVRIEAIPPSAFWDLVPGSGDAIEPSSALGSLDARLSRQAVVTARITYPPESGLPEAERTGVLVFAKATLVAAMDYDVLSYAARNGIFPRDSTGDQFFDDGKFCAYRDLGRDLGAIAAVTQAGPVPVSPPAPRPTRRPGRRTPATSSAPSSATSDEVIDLNPKAR